MVSLRLQYLSQKAHSRGATSRRCVVFLLLGAAATVPHFKSAQVLERVLCCTRRLLDTERLVFQAAPGNPSQARQGTIYSSPALAKRMRQSSGFKITCQDAFAVVEAHSSSPRSIGSGAAASHLYFHIGGFTYFMCKARRCCSRRDACDKQHCSDTAASQWCCNIVPCAKRSGCCFNACVAQRSPGGAGIWHIKQRLAPDWTCQHLPSGAGTMCMCIITHFHSTVVCIQS